MKLVYRITLALALAATSLLAACGTLTSDQPVTSQEERGPWPKQGRN